MEQSSFVANEEPSAFPHSEFNPGHQDDQGIQEEYEAEQRDIEEGVDRQLAEMGDDDLDLVESEDDSDEYSDHHNPNTMDQHHNINTLNPLSRNVANIHRTASFDHQSPGIHGQFRTSTQIGQTPSLFQHKGQMPVHQEHDPIYSDGTKAMTERRFLHTEEEYENINRLPILYEAREQEIRKLKQELDETNKKHDEETRSLRHQVTLLKSEQENLNARLENEREKNNLIFNEKFRINENVEDLSKRLHESESIRKQLEIELDSTKMTLDTLHAQHTELQQSDTVFKAKQMYEENVSSLRERHEKELFHLHQEIKKLTLEKNQKDDQIESLRRNASKIQNDYDMQEIKKNDIMKEYQDRLRDAQTRLQQQISENASYNYTNVKAMEERAREDKEKYAQELLKFKDKEEDFLLLQKRYDELKSKYSSLQNKVRKYQNHQKKKEQKYLEQIRQTEEKCCTTMVEIKKKTKEAIENKNKQYQDEVLQMHKMFEDEMGKITSMSLRCSDNILDAENNKNEPNIESNSDIHHYPGQVLHRYASDQKVSENHVKTYNTDLKENKAPQDHYYTVQKTLDSVAGSDLQPFSPNTQAFITNYSDRNFGNNLEPTTDNLNKVFLFEYLSARTEIAQWWL